jgi:hypothetical protein
MLELIGETIRWVVLALQVLYVIAALGSLLWR